jgi:hypothetical protein
MNDGGFAFIQAVFHVVLFIVIHGQRTKQRPRVNRGKTSQSVRECKAARAAGLSSRA